MKIVLFGVQTNNKGAELMLYAILEEIERKFPEAKVYIRPSSITQGLGYVKTSLSFQFWPFSSFLIKSHLGDFLRKMHFQINDYANFIKADYFFDGSGFRFSDQTNLWGTTSEWWDILLKRQFKNGTKIIFLPQAFGPIEAKNTKQVISSIGKYASLIMPREQVSYKYLKDSGLVNMQKVKLYTDFTSLVEGVFPSKYEKLRGGICIIPNMKMIDQGKISFKDYIRLLSCIVCESKSCGRTIYLLNHEGARDENLAYQCQQSVKGEVEVVTGLNALEVKGLIASAYLVVTSRFHGLASSLNSGVPSLATSWSHKYAELYKDYALDNYVLPLDNNDLAINKIHELLNIDNNNRIRKHLASQIPLIKEQTKAMWDVVWGI